MKVLKPSFRGQQLRKKLEQLQADLDQGLVADTKSRLERIYHEIQIALNPLPGASFFGEIARYAFCLEEREIFVMARRCLTPGLLNSAAAATVQTAVADALANWPKLENPLSHPQQSTNRYSDQSTYGASLTTTMPDKNTTEDLRTKGNKVLDPSPRP